MFASQVNAIFKLTLSERTDCLHFVFNNENSIQFNFMLQSSVCKCGLIIFQFQSECVSVVRMCVCGVHVCVCIVVVVVVENKYENCYRFADELSQNGKCTMRMRVMLDRNYRF